MDNEGRVMSKENDSLIDTCITITDQFVGVADDERVMWEEIIALVRDSVKQEGVIVPHIFYKSLREKAGAWDLEHPSTYNRLATKED